LYQNLDNLAQPWMTLQVLEQAEGEILSDLLAKCRQVERGLPGPTWSQTARRWAVMVLALVGVGAGAGLLFWAGDGVWAPLLERAGSWWRLLCSAVEHSSPTQRWIVAGVVLVMIGMYWVTRTPPT
jgi:hypothetical protein